MTKKKVVFITQYNRDPEQVRDSNVVEFIKPSMVKESLSYAVDINTIYDSFCKTGKVPLNGNKPVYSDDMITFDSLIDAQKIVNEATSYFQSLPTDIRNQYGNSLQAFVRALNDGDSYLVDKGVLVPRTPIKDDLHPSVPVEPSTPIVQPDLAVTEPVNTATTDNL